MASSGGFRRCALADRPELRQNISRAPGKILTNGKKRWVRMEKHFHMSLTCIFRPIPPPSRLKILSNQTMFLGKIREKNFYTKNFFRKFFTLPPEYLQVVCRNRNGTCSNRFQKHLLSVFPGFPAIPASSQISQIYAKFGSILAKKGHFWHFHQKVKT